MDQNLSDLECPACGGLYLPYLAHVGEANPNLERCREDRQQSPFINGYDPDVESYFR